MWSLILACRAPEPAPRPQGTDADPSPTAETGPGTVAATHTGGADHSAGVETLDCGAAPAGPFPTSQSDVVHTEEDFDFDRDGHLLSQRNTNLVGILRDGTVTVVATAIGYDAAGIRSLPDGRVAVAEPDTAGVDLVDLGTGAVRPLLSGLEFPNGLEAAVDGSLYVSEFVPNGHVRRVDPATGQSRLLLDVDYPNGMALSPDEQTLYVVSSAGLLGLGASTVYALHRTGAGWAAGADVFYDSPTTLGGLTTDACGNVYAIGYDDGEVIRLPPDGGAPTPIATLAGAGFWSSLRFAPGYGNWPRTELYATSRREFYGIEVGVPGRHVLAP